MCSASSAKRFFSTEWADPPFIDTRRDGVHAQEIMEVVVFSPNRGGAVVKHCRKYTAGMASGMAVVLGVVLGLAEIAPASL